MALTRLEIVRREPFDLMPTDEIRLVDARYLLAGDVDLCVYLAAERYDAVVNIEA